MTTLYAVLPAGVDDPARPSGGNVYDRRVLDVASEALGRRVDRAPGRRRLADARAPTTWPGWTPSAGRGSPDGARRRCVDGLVASGAARGLPRARGAPAGRRAPPHAASAPTAARSRCSRRPPPWSPPARGRGSGCGAGTACPRVDVALPGADPVDAARPHRSAAGGTSFLCVAAVHPGKGHDLLLRRAGPASATGPGR